MPGSTKVVDSWAIIAWIRDEPAASAFESFLNEASNGQIELVMSWLNVAEAFYTLSKRTSRRSAEEFLSGLPSLPIRVVLRDEKAIMRAARIKAKYPVAFGDSFAVALAQDEDASVITGDDEIRRCAAVPVDWIGS